MNNSKNKTVQVNISEKKTGYPIIIGENLLENTCDYILQNTPKIKKALIVTNQTIANFYLESVLKSFENSDIKVDVLKIKEGEQYKNRETLFEIWDKALELKLERKDGIIALGGGVIGDLTGFAASTYLRGTNFIQIPTTLLAAVDSSVGGKTGINHEKGKNLLGAFYQPRLVLMDINCLKTLPEREIKTGLAEVVKYGFIEKVCSQNNFDFLNFLNENAEKINKLEPETIKELIKNCCSLKASVVEQDEKEQGLRAVLNLGHTTGHGIEKCTNYVKYTHGEAVSLGLISAFFISKTLNKIDENYYQSSLDLIKKFNLLDKLDKEVNSNEILKATELDKKVSGGKKRFVLPTNIGKVEIFDNIDDATILKAIEILY